MTDAEVRNLVLRALDICGPLTLRAAVSVTGMPYHRIAGALHYLSERGELTKGAQIQTGKRGRPGCLWTLA